MDQQKIIRECLARRGINDFIEDFATVCNNIAKSHNHLPSDTTKWQALWHNRAQKLEALNATKEFI